MYEPVQMLGEGSFGRVFLVKDVKTRQVFAMKVEQQQHNLLAYEARMLKLLSTRHRSIPRLEWFGYVNDGQQAMVQELLGLSLEDIRLQQGGKMDLYDTMRLAMQAIESVKFIHSQCMIHRDLKPENFMMGRDKKSNILHIIDFGLAKLFKNPKTNVHIPYRNDKSMTGTPRFASIDNHRGREQGRKDDLESLLYVFIFLAKGSLPWQGITIPDRVRDERKYKNKVIQSWKERVLSRDLCRDLPNCFRESLDYVKSLAFAQKPNYDYLITLFASEAEARFGRLHWNFSFCRQVSTARD